MRESENIPEKLTIQVFDVALPDRIAAIDN